MWQTVPAQILLKVAIDEVSQKVCKMHTASSLDASQLDYRYQKLATHSLLQKPELEHQWRSVSSGKTCKTSNDIPM
jgi:hypothetical protein